MDRRHHRAVLVRPCPCRPRTRHPGAACPRGLPAQAGPRQPLRGMAVGPGDHRRCRALRSGKPGRPHRLADHPPRRAPRRLTHPAGHPMNALPPRLVWLHLRSRRAPLALALVIAIAAVLRLMQPWAVGPGPFAGTLPLALATGAAAMIAASTQSPFAGPERATWPAPWLRLIQVAAFVLAAAGLLALARLGHDPLAAIRNLAGLTGLALITATLISAPLAWITPLAYVLYCGADRKSTRLNSSHVRIS